MRSASPSSVTCGTASHVESWSALRMRVQGRLARANPCASARPPIPAPAMSNGCSRVPMSGQSKHANRRGHSSAHSATRRGSRRSLNGVNTTRRLRRHKPRPPRRTCHRNFRSARRAPPASKRRRSGAFRAGARDARVARRILVARIAQRGALHPRSVAGRAFESGDTPRVPPCALPRRAWSNTPDRSTSRPGTSSSPHLSAMRDASRG